MRKLTSMFSRTPSQKKNNKISSISRIAVDIKHNFFDISKILVMVETSIPNISRVPSKYLAMVVHSISSLP